MDRVEQKMRKWMGSAEKREPHGVAGVIPPAAGESASPS
jgi:hypothetical protein